MWHTRQRDEEPDAVAEQEAEGDQDLGPDLLILRIDLRKAFDAVHRQGLSSYWLLPMPRERTPTLTAQFFGSPRNRPQYMNSGYNTVPG